jgi:hypothetical protein
MDSDSADDSGFTAETAATDSTEEDAAMAIAHRDLDQNALNGVDELIGNLGMLNVIDELLIDDSHPGELREAWETILDAYAVRGDELSAYLESAFKTVIESTLVFQSAEREIELLEEVLRKAEEAGLQIDSDALLAEIREARENVKQASDQLRAAIAAAGEKGRAGQFDQALEDVIIAALRQLEQRNERLFVDSHVIEAVRTHVQEVLDADDPSAGNLQIEAIASESRAEATQQFTEMRERWDAAAQDVFSAFLARMVSGRANQGQMQDVQTYNLNTPQSPDQQ